MAKSRIVAWLLLLMVAGAARAQSDDPDGLIEAQRDTLRRAMRLDCPPAGADAEILVCGSRDEDLTHRLLLPIEREPRAADRAAGEQRAALAIDSSRCTAVGRAQQCTGGLDMIGIGVAIARAVAQAIAGDD